MMGLITTGKGAYHNWKRSLARNTCTDIHEHQRHTPRSTEPHSDTRIGVVVGVVGVAVVSCADAGSAADAAACAGSAAAAGCRC